MTTYGIVKNTHRLHRIWRSDRCADFYVGENINNNIIKQ